MSAIDRIAAHFANGSPAGAAHEVLTLGAAQFQDVDLKQAAVLVPLTVRDGKEALLLTRRAEHLRHHGGQVSFPGGRVEALDQGPVATALRETREETGIPESAIEVFGTMPRQITITGFEVTPVVGRVRHDEELILDPGEVDSAFEVPLEFLSDPEMMQQKSRRFHDRALVMPEWQYADYRIWGATAWMIKNLINIINYKE